MNKIADKNKPWKVIETVLNAYGHKLRDEVVAEFASEHEARDHERKLQAPVHNFAWSTNTPSQQFNTTFDRTAVASEIVKIAKELIAREPRIDILRRIVERHQYEKIDGMVIDVQTAQLLVQMYDILTKRGSDMSTFEKAPLTRLVDLGWRSVKGSVRVTQPQLLSDLHQDHQLGIAIDAAAMKLVDMAQMDDFDHSFPSTVEEREKFVKDTARVLGYKFRLSTNLHEAIADLIWEKADTYL